MDMGKVLTEMQSPGDLKGLFYRIRQGKPIFFQGGFNRLEGVHTDSMQSRDFLFGALGQFFEGGDTGALDRALGGFRQPLQ